MVPVLANRPDVLFCRIAAVAFLAVSVYTIVVKLPSGDMADDWAHTVLHVITFAVAMLLGWYRSEGAGPWAFTWLVVIVYGALGVLGWFVDGVAMSAPYRIPLGAADNVFHLALAVTGVGLIVFARSRGRGVVDDRV